MVFFRKIIFLLTYLFLQFYFLRHLFYFRQRVEEEKADWIIYLTDLGQATHFQQVFACAQQAGVSNLKKWLSDYVPI